MVNKSTLSICIGACLLGALPATVLAASSAPDNVSIHGARQGASDGYDPVVDPVTGELLSQEEARALYSIQGASNTATAPALSNITIQGANRSKERAAWTELPNDAAILPLGEEVVMHADNNAQAAPVPQINSATAMAAAQAANNPVEKAKRAVAAGDAQREADAKAAAAAKAKAEAEEAQAKANAALQAAAEARALELAKAKQAQMKEEQEKQAKANKGALANTATDNDHKANADASATTASSAVGNSANTKASPAALLDAASATAKDANSEIPDPKKPAPSPKDRADAENVAKAIAAVKQQFSSPYDGPTTKEERREMAKHYGKSYSNSSYQYVAKPILPPKPAYKEAKVGTAWDSSTNTVRTYPSNVVAAATAAAAATASTSAAVTAAAHSAAQGPFQGSVTTIEPQQTQAQAVQTQAAKGQSPVQAAQGQASANTEASDGKASGGSKVIAVGSELDVNGTQAQSNQATREQLVRVYGTNTPSMVGTVEEVAKYRKGLPQTQPNLNYAQPSNVYTYTDQNGNTVVVQTPNGYNLDTGVYLYGNYGFDGQPLPPGWTPPPSWPPANGQLPNYAPPPGMHMPNGPVTPSTPGWPADPGSYPPAAWQPGNQGPNYAPPPGMQPPPDNVVPGTPGWPADPGVNYVQPRK